MKYQKYTSAIRFQLAYPNVKNTLKTNNSKYFQKLILQKSASQGVKWNQLRSCYHPI